MNGLFAEFGIEIVIGVVAFILTLVGVGVSRSRKALPAPDVEQERAALEAMREVASTPEAETGPSLREVREQRKQKIGGSELAEDALLEEKKRRQEGVRSQQESAAERLPATAEVEKEAEPSNVLVDASEEAAPAPPVERTLSDGLERTRGGFMSRLGSLFASDRSYDDDFVDELEEVLFTADLGVPTSQHILDVVTQALESGVSVSEAYELVRIEAEKILLAHHAPFELPSDQLRVVMMVGVNGVGKTTSIGKLAARYKAAGRRVLLVAGDTFRAAAADQLQEWAGRVGVDIHRGADGADPSGVVFDGLQRAVKEGYDLVFVDTAGRLQTKKPLMDELQKIGRVCAKAVPDAPHETVLVVDANTGQNAIQQARLFGEVTPLSGLVLTKLDGTAKGGVVVGISAEMEIPIYFVGIGEAISDLRRFEPSEFVEAIF